MVLASLSVRQELVHTIGLPWDIPMRWFRWISLDHSISVIPVKGITSLAVLMTVPEK
ncbi:MAG TPA: hypothetical protein VH796_07755 [Nitrososphaeraceae archaeon]